LRRNIRVCDAANVRFSDFTERRFFASVTSNKKSSQRTLVKQLARTERPMTAFDALALEPDLDDLLKDPIVKLLMKKDGVTPKKLLPILKEAASKLDASHRLHAA
jgi:hypothetical protein